MSFILLGILNSQVTGAAGGAYELIESNILTSSASSVTFSSIPQDYKHLQIRAVGKSTDTSSDNRSLLFRMNGVTTSSYRNHELVGTGSTVFSSSFLDTDMWLLDVPASNSEPSQIFGVGVVDILDYTNTSKNTTVRSLSGKNGSVGTKVVRLNSGLFLSTNAVTEISVRTQVGNLASGSRFSLYGIRG